MTIRRGGLTIGAIFSGSTAIGRLYRGTDLVFVQGGGDPPERNQLSMLGIADAQSSTKNFAANTVVLQPLTTPAGEGGAIASIHVGLKSSAPAGAKMKAVIYRAGGDLVAVGTEVTLTASGVDYFIELPFGAPASLDAAADYLIGIITDTVISRDWGSGAAAVAFAQSYVGTMPATLPSTAIADTLRLWVVYQEVAAPGTNGFVTAGLAISTRSGLLPTCQIGDMLIFQGTIINSTTFANINPGSGWSSINEGAMDGLAGYRMGIFSIVIASVADYRALINWTDAGNASRVTLARTSVYRGFDAVEGAGASDGRSATATAPALTTLGPDRIGLTFFGWQHPGAPGAFPAAWTQDYIQVVATGFNGQHTAGHKTIPTATTEAARSLSLAASEQWRAVSLALVPKAA